MDEDNPDYLVHEIFTQNFWKDHPLGKPILGTKETVKRFERRCVFDSYAHRFAPSNMIVSAAGNLNHDRFVELVTGTVRAYEADEQRLPLVGTENHLAYHPAQQEVAGAGAIVHRRAVTSDRPREAVRLLHSEYRAGRRHEFAAVPEDPRAPGAGVLDLQRSQSRIATPDAWRCMPERRWIRLRRSCNRS